VELALVVEPVAAELLSEPVADRVPLAEVSEPVAVKLIDKVDPDAVELTTPLVAEVGAAVEEVVEGPLPGIKTPESPPGGTSPPRPVVSDLMIHSPVSGMKVKATQSSSPS
jgi:hypothetical protein